MTTDTSKSSPPPATKSSKDPFFPYADKPNQYRSNVPPYTPSPRNLLWYIKFLVGVACTTNFLIFWAIPIFGQGQLWKQLLVYIFRPIYNITERNYYLRSFAEKYVYHNPRYADYAATAFYLLISISASLGYVFYYQLRYGDLPAWLIAAYFCAWVGFGGRVMGGCYTFAHKEGHDGFFYKTGFRSIFGNFFENIVGPFWGNIPYNFTTSHIAIHHKLNGGKGDTFYQWDCDRTSWRDLMIYQTRILMHTTGISSLAFFAAKENKKFFRLLSKGMFVYYIVYPAIIYAITRSPKFLFFIYFQPMFCMTYFLAFMNFAFHAFIEFDSEGKHILPVSATMIIDGDDDYFGEDDHMTHHISVRTYWRDLPNYQEQHRPEFNSVHASIFRGMSIVEMAVLLLIKQWDLLAERYVDHTNSLTKEQIKSMLQARATAIEPQGKNYAIVIDDETQPEKSE